MSLPVLAYTLLGMMVGSFLNVCIHRIPRRESVVRPRSHCPECGNTIRSYDNIPILSYLFLRGRCRFCRAPISLRYPLVEAGTGAAFLACQAAWGFSPTAYVNSIFLCLIIVLIFIDYDHQILPNAITIRGTAAGILLSPFQNHDFFNDLLSEPAAGLLSRANPAAALPWIGSVLGALVGGGLLFLVGFLYEKVRRRPGMGMGDVKMMAMVGSFLGWRLALLSIFAGSFLGSLAGLFLVFFRGKTMQARLAFGTFLGVGCMLSLFYGLPLIHWFAGR